ncbi:hypothetical protein FA13DRAFT_1733653 [Coprinellus micaceus]|uniref:Uncharacterized protein n=1 Tax=Coprinellus micaceus TaxID=71717 RepID=A0A4Y7T854_COPMI|nr:hypothetical protein FA13DRAFT_1733653 [Coprinellus micaceus]
MLLKSGDLLHFPSTIVKHVELDIDFEITLCPALQKKPAEPEPHFDIETTKSEVIADRGDKVDPFAPPYDPHLYVGELKDEPSEEEFVVLVRANFRSQASPLLPSELVQTYSLLVAGRHAGKNLFAFYNCGDHSGASQPHKHIQFLPRNSPLGPPIERLARKARIEFPTRPFALNQLPYASHSFRFPSHLETFPSEELERILSEAFMQLLDLSIQTIRHDEDYPVGRPSYNVIITLEHMHLIPRKREAHVLAKTGEKLPVNSLGFAGMLLVKSEKELEAVKEETIGKILRGVGLESVLDQQCDGTAQEVKDVL